MSATETPPPSLSKAPSTAASHLPSLSLSDSASLSLPPQLAGRVDVQSRLLKIALLTSVVLHAGLFVGWLVFPSTPTTMVDLDEAVIKTRLVKLGKPRDEKLLPRLPSSPPPPPADKKAPPTIDPTVPQTPDTKPTPQTPDKPSAADILEKFKADAERPKDINDVIKDRIGEQTDEGREDGDAGGTALDGEINASYYARVTASIQRQMQVSSVLTPDQLVRLKAKLCFKVDDVGELTDLQVVTSGSTVFDSDILAAARRASPVPAPPPTTRKQAADGICVNFCPTSCR